MVDIEIGSMGIYAPKRGFFGLFIGTEVKPLISGHIYEVLKGSKGELFAEKYAKTVAELLGERDNGKLIKELKELSKHRNYKGEEEYGWGSFNFTYYLRLPTKDTPITDALKLNLWISLATTLLAKYYGLPLGDAQHLVYRTLNMVLSKGSTKRDEVLPHSGNKEKLLTAMEGVRKDYPIIPDNHVPKIVDALTTLWEEIDRNLPSSKEAEKELREFIKRKHLNDSLLTLTPEDIILQVWLKSASEIADPSKIRQIAQELEQISPFKKKETTAVAPTTKTITQKIPSEVEEAFRTLKGMGVDLKLETGNVAERKAKIYAWMVQNGLIRVEQEGEKVRIVPTEKMHELLAKHGKAAGAILKWAAEEGVGLEHVEPVGKVVSALEELRQIAKKRDPALARTLEKAMTRKTVVKELNLLASGLISVEELSELWNVDFSELLKSEKLKSAIIKAMRNAEKSGLASPEVPAEWIPFLEKLKANSITEDDLRKALNLATVGRMVFSALESVAIRGLPSETGEIEELLLEVLKKTPDFLPFEVKVVEELEEKLRELAVILALMKDESHIERLEEKIIPIIERIPETRKVGLFRRDSPRKRVEDFVALIMSGKITEEEMEEKAEELKKYLREYLSEEETTELIETITLPFTARALLEAYGTAEDFLFAYAHARASRYLTVEGRLMEALKRKSYGGLHDDLVKALSWIPSLRRAKVTLEGYEKNRKLFR